VFTVLTVSTKQPFVKGWGLSLKAVPAIRDVLFFERSQRQEAVKTAAICISNLMKRHLEVSEMNQRNELPAGPWIDHKLRDRQSAAGYALRKVELHRAKVKDVTDLLQEEYGYPWESIVKTMSHFGYVEPSQNTRPESVPQSVETQSH
jgi:hypothetical protein